MASEEVAAVEGAEGTDPADERILLLSVVLVLVFIGELAERSSHCWFYVLLMMCVLQCATASRHVVTEVMVCRGSVQKDLLNRNLLI